MNIGILGSGRWAKALAILAAEAGRQARIGYVGKPPGGFPGSPNIAAVAKEADLILIACLPRDFREMVKRAQLGPSSEVMIASRGIEPQSGKWLSDIIGEESAAKRIGVLGGPALAEEVLKKRPNAMVVSSAFDALQLKTQQALLSPICRIYLSYDVRGVELAAMMVDALTMALGIVDSLNQGVGVRGVIVTRGIAEAARLGRAYGAQDNTFFGMAGVGDVVACSSSKTHKYYVAGRDLGAGRGIPITRLETLQALCKLGDDKQIELPLTKALTAIALGKLRPRLALDMLMRREIGID